MHVYYTYIKSDSYSQLSVDADLVGVVLTESGRGLKICAVCTQLYMYYNPTILKFLDPLTGQWGMQQAGQAFLAKS